ncbi:flavodoxin family protein [uncultured Lacinutrix sp.]|uniref:flavodoxin family protein n=1 Tax=uncultured Lacinutrix sp. TaxID=574032 RepID=UPI00260D80D2|nr:NAD(P)H-dependent oxidoreductase [uncultured Lacinutrix sp.]
MKKGIIIQGSSRSNGDTSKIVSILKTKTGFDVVDLKTKNIGHFDYEFKNKADDFASLFKNIVTNYKVIVFVTPIYWYAMSGIMKVFFDRISDFLKLEKDYGRQLRGMDMASVSSSNDSRFYEGFEMPFENSADYLGMNYKGHLHTWIDNGSVSIEVNNNIEEFVNSKLLK